MYSSFTFNGKSSETFGIVSADFDNSGLEDFSAGTQTEFETESNYDGSKWYSVSNKYNEPLEMELQLIKNPCSNEYKYFTRNEVRAILSWLCSPYDYQPFKIDNKFFYGMNFQAKFINPQYKVIGEKVCGLQITVKMEHPFALSDDIKYKKTFNGSGTMTLFNHSDEFDKCLYPQKVIITALSNGKISIHNNNNENKYISTEFTNCVTNEVITMNSDERMLSSTNTSTPITERFSKNWIRLSPNENIFTVTGNCTIEFIYNEIRRIGVF